MGKNGGDPLGIITKFSTTCPPQSGGKTTDFDAELQIRRQRYNLQEQAQNLLHKDDADKWRRVVGCSRTMLASVGIHKSQEHNSTFYSGLLICGSVWACPVCSAKIQARRAHEISSVCFYAYHNGKKTVMMTFTHPHRLGQSLADNMRMHNEALRLFRMGRAFQLFKKRAGYSGLVRGNEVTYGRNGWHYHDHELWLVDADFDIYEEYEWLVERWLKCCKKAGFTIDNEDAFREHGVDVMDECHATDYLAKMGVEWGADKELAKGASKASGNTPFKLISKKPSLFVEYANATKGKVQLFFSQGLKEAAGLQEKTDEQLATEFMDKAELIVILERVAWRVVLQEKARADLLQIALNSGFEGVSAWFDNHGIEIERGKTTDEKRH